jgi:recombination protein RecT
MSEKKDLAVREGGIVGFVQTTNKKIVQFQEKCNDTLMNIFNDERLIRRFITSVQICCSRTPKLNQCTQESFRDVLLACAELRLFPSPVTGQCYLVPFKNKGVLEATFILGYQGMITLAERSGVQMIDAQVVYEKDKVDCTLGTNPNITHTADIFSADRGAPKGVYALAILKSGHTRIFPMSMEDVNKHRGKSKSWMNKDKQKYSPWHENNDPQLTMPKKTAIRQLFKFIPKDDLTTMALTIDMENETRCAERVINGERQLEYDADDNAPNDMDIAAFVQEAREFLNVPPNEGVPQIYNALQDVTGTDSFDGITSEQLEAVKRLVFTGEAPSVDADGQMEIPNA